MSLPTLEDIDTALAESSLSQFIKLAWPIIEPGTPYLHNWHIDAICEHLEAVDAGQITRLLINVPPRYMKSIAVSVMWPVRSWLRTPAMRWLFGSYSGSLSTKHSVDRRTIIQSEWYQSRWLDRFQLTTDQNVKTEYRNDKQGVMVATSFGGTATGKGGNRVVVDDPHDPTGAESQQVRESDIVEFDRKFSTRLDDKKTGAIVIVMQRLNETDLSGHVLKQGGYTHLSLQGVADQRTIISLPSGKVITREAGDLLWPEREGPKEIEQARMQLRPYGFAGQYQQRPAPAGGGLFKSAWYRYWREAGDFYQLLTTAGAFKSVRKADCARFATMDVAGTEKKVGNDPDWTVLQVWDETPSFDLLLVDQWRVQAETPEVVDGSIRFARLRDVPHAFVEYNGLGLGVVQTMRRRGFAVRGVRAKGDKVQRSQTAQIRMEMGAVYFPESAPFLHDLQAELEAFPNGAHDDQVDALSYAALCVQRRGGAAKRPDDHQRESDAETTEREAIRQAESVAMESRNRMLESGGIDQELMPDPLAEQRGWVELDV